MSPAPPESYRLSGGAGAAALLELSAGLTAKRLAEAGDDAAAEAQIEIQRSASEIRGTLVSAADTDSAVCEQVMAASDPEARARALDRASEPPLSVAESCADLAAAAAETAARSREWAFNADA
ncbi:MAG: hypothetical protein FJW90_10800, partial [Actinobacteria bacterium]|nr:hypothetical protein [Actinomycetota bacterium]